MKREILKMPNDVIMHDYWIALIAFSIGSFKAIGTSTINFRVHRESVTDKSKRTILVRIKLLLDIFTGSQNNYKNQNILQAESFFNIYKERLNQENSNDIRKFLALKNKNAILRKIYVGYLKFLSKS